MEPKKPTLAEVHYRLCEPFKPGDEKYRILTKSKDGKRGKPCAYIDARCVSERLDEVVGPDNWSTDLEKLANGAVICRMTVLGVMKSDIGMVNHKATNRQGEVDLDKEVMNEKGSGSDAIKRAAQNFGIGRYLYAMDLPWVNLTEKGYLPDGYAPPSKIQPAPSFKSKVETPNDVADFAARPASATRIKTIRDMLAERDIGENHKRVLVYLEKNSVKTLDDLTNQAAAMLITGLKDIPRVAPRGEATQEGKG